MDFDEEQLRSLIRPIENWPKPGVTFRDITPLLQTPSAMAMVTQALIQLFSEETITHIGVLEARGFLFGTQVAASLHLPLIPFRKPSKLPYHCISESYMLEYGSATIEVHEDALSSGDQVLLVDDLLATGGTLNAAATLCQRLQANVVGAAVMIDLPALGGSKMLQEKGICTKSLISY